MFFYSVFDLFPVGYASETLKPFSEHCVVLPQTFTHSCAFRGMLCDAMVLQYSSYPVCCQVRQELTEEYEQVKGIMGTLESFRSEKPVDIPAPQSDDRPEDPAVWPPPTPAEHRCVEITPLTESVFRLHAWCTP